MQFRYNLITNIINLVKSLLMMTLPQIIQSELFRYYQFLSGNGSNITTEPYTHLGKKSLHKIKSPLDRILEGNSMDDNNLQQ